MTHPIPASALDRPAAFVGATGSGKTFAAKGSAEVLLVSGRRLCVIDPTGVWWGLRTAADGEQPGFPVVIFGGDHADVPIEPDIGERLGEILAAGDVRASIVDISEMSGGEQTRFLTDLFETLYARNREAMHLILDEADAAAPQNPMPEGRRLLGAIDKIARRGRVKGFRLWTITQRPAVLHKNILSQVATLVALRLGSPQDRKAIDAWVQGNADAGKAREVLDSLPKLDVGEGWVWCPSEDVLNRVRFPAIATFDSSRTPEYGEEVREARSFAAVDVAALRSALSVAERERQPDTNSTAKRQPDAGELRAAEQRGYERGRAEALRDGAKAIEALGAEVRAVARRMQADVARLIDMAVVVAEATEDASAEPLKRDVDPAPKNEAPPRAAGGGISPTSRLIIAEIQKAYPVSLTFKAAALRAGASPRSSQFRRYEREVHAAAEIDVLDGGRLKADLGLLPEGLQQGPSDPVEAFASKLAPSVASMLRVLAQARGSLDRASIAEQAGVSLTSSGLGAGLRELVEMGLVDRHADGRYQLSPDMRSE